jgi:hypothetical protein
VLVLGALLGLVPEDLVVVTPLLGLPEVHGASFFHLLRLRSLLFNGFARHPETGGQLSVRWLCLERNARKNLSIDKMDKPP